MQQYEIARKYIPYIKGTWKDNAWLDPTEASPTAWEEAQKMAAEGWELVSVVSLIGGYAGGHSGCSYTKGYYLFFRRPRA